MRKSKKAKAKARIERTTSVKTSVKSYQQGIGSEKQKTSTYSKEFEAGVKSLQSDIKNAALKMREEGIEHMGKKVAKFGKEIEDQVTENREATSYMAANVKYFISEIDKKKNDFQSCINTFWG